MGLANGGYIIAVGRLEATKRFDDLVAARNAAGEDALPLVIVGGSVGDEQHESELRAAAGPGVIFAGFRAGAELAALYRGAAAFVHASQMEGFGLVVLEALLAGLPARLSDIPAHREFGLPDGCYFPVGDREQDRRQSSGLSSAYWARTEPVPASSGAAASPRRRWRTAGCVRCLLTAGLPSPHPRTTPDLDRRSDRR
ncbi:glycosyltransferase [Sphingomonas sp. MMS24-JH45]